MAEGVTDKLKTVSLDDSNEQRLPEIYREIMKSYDVLETTEESTNSDKNQVLTLLIQSTSCSFVRILVTGTAPFLPFRSLGQGYIAMIFIIF